MESENSEDEEGVLVGVERENVGRMKWALASRREEGTLTTKKQK